MGRRGLAIFALGLVAGCVSPPDVVIEVGETRPELSESGEGSGSGEGSAAEPWEAPGPVGQSVLAVETRPGNGWSVGTVVAPGVFVGAALGGPPTGLRWRDAAGNEGGATVLAAERSTGLYVARATALSIPPLALDFEEHAPAVRLVGHPTFGLDRGGWLSLGFARTYEDCDNGLDDDGDGVADCDDGACASVTACLGEWPEDCRNGADDDLDGLEDCEDADCRRDSRCEDTCSPARALKLPQDVGLDGAPLVDDCGRVTALVGITNRRFNTAEACAPSERASVETAAPLEPLACIGGARPEIPTVRIRALLDSVGVSTGTAADCVQDETEAVDVANAARGQSVSGTTLAMLRRARSMVYAGPGFSAVKVADPPILVAPTDALPPFNDTADSLVGIDGTTISLASSFQRPEPFSQTLSAIF